jgi:hypothetical protein
METRGRARTLDVDDGARNCDMKASDGAGGGNCGSMIAWTESRSAIQKSHIPEHGQEISNAMAVDDIPESLSPRRPSFGWRRRRPRVWGCCSRGGVNLEFGHLGTQFVHQDVAAVVSESKGVVFLVAEWPLSKGTLGNEL